MMVFKIEREREREKEGDKWQHEGENKQLRGLHKDVTLSTEKEDTAMAELVQGPVDLKEVSTISKLFALCLPLVVQKDERSIFIFTLANNWPHLQRILQTCSGLNVCVLLLPPPPNSDVEFLKPV